MADPVFLHASPHCQLFCVGHVVETAAGPSMSSEFLNIHVCGGTLPMFGASDKDQARIVLRASAVTSTALHLEACVFPVPCNSALAQFTTFL